MPDETYQRGLDRLIEQGFELIGTHRGRNSEGCREIEVIAEIDSPNTTRDIESKCSEAFGVAADLGVVTYISRGTDTDAHSVLTRFGVNGNVHREVDEHDEELVTVTISRESERRVPESRLHTALEAALNCEVRIVRV
ncbi:hypothetical protein [Rhodococcus sp. P1Y]|uniref:hypothetical protein n=1 Tax=Rhodococcus sp. P1Y TaxID=1302308 RepID=UPI001294001A|nr:hypothetical protein [Rhodococcus sp. P1Y]